MDYGFIYIWYDRKPKRYYIGAHWGSEDDGYICSSAWMRQAYKTRPQDFKRRVVSRIYTNKMDMFDRENQFLELIEKDELGKRYYNLQKHWRHWSQEEDKSKAVGQKISDSHKADPNWGQWHKGKKFTDEHRKNLSESHKNLKQPQSQIDKRRKSNTGKKRNEHFRADRSRQMQGNNNPMYGKSPTEERRKEISEHMRKTFWWNNGKINLRQAESPGEEYIRGRV